MLIRRVTWQGVFAVGAIALSPGCKEAKDHIAGVDRATPVASVNVAKGKVDELAAYYRGKVEEVRRAGHDHDKVHQIAVSARLETISDDLSEVKERLSEADQNEVQEYWLQQVGPVMGEWIDAVKESLE